MLLSIHAQQILCNKLPAPQRIELMIVHILLQIKYTLHSKVYNTICFHNFPPSRHPLVSIYFSFSGISTCRDHMWYIYTSEQFVAFISPNWIPECRVPLCMKSNFAAVQDTMHYERVYKQRYIVGCIQHKQETSALIDALFAQSLFYLI